MATTLTPLATDGFWSNEREVDGLLAKKLRAGSTSLVLGAGASSGFNLPDWARLVERVRDSAGVKPPERLMRSEDEADRLFVENFDRDRLKFAKAVRASLYEGASNTPDFLLKSELLQALSAFVANSLRGRGGAIVTFNFDDILESYLKLLGYVVRSEVTAPAWASTADMHIYHPHGLLPLASESGITPIVFTASDFDDVVGDSSEAWNQTIRATWNSTFPIFVGLSGDDMRLRANLNAVKKVHPAIVRDSSKYWGLRPTLRTENSYNVGRWREMGIAPRFIDSYDQLPSFLLSICQKAADLHV